MKFFSLPSYISILTLLFTAKSALGDVWRSRACLSFEDPFDNRIEKQCVISKNEFVFRGKTIELPCVYEISEDPPLLQWFKNGRQIPLEDRVIEQNDGESLMIKDVDIEDSGVYTCKAHYGPHSGLYSINLEVQSPPYFTFRPQDVNVIRLNTAKIRCQVNGAPKPTIKWLQNNRELNNKQYEVLESGDLIISSVGLNGTIGNYTCRATNIYGFVEKTVYLGEKERTIIVDRTPHGKVNAGDTITLRCLAHHDPSLKLRYDWLKNSDAIDVESEPRIFASADNSKLTILKARQSDTAGYVCVASTEFDTSTTATYIEVEDVPKSPILLGVDCGAKGARVSWNDAKDKNKNKVFKDGALPITHYSIEYNTSFTPYTWDVADDNITVNNKSYFIKLSPWTNYTFRVIAWNKIGPSEPSLHSSVCTTPPDVPYENPDMLEIKEEWNPFHHLKIKWKVMLQIKHNAPNFAYRVYYKRDTPGQNWTIRNLPSWRRTEHSFKVTELSYQRYRIKVTAVNSIGECKEPPQEIVCGGEDTLMQASTNLILEKVISNTTALLTWDKFPGESAKAELHHYKIETWSDNDDWEQISRKFYFISTNETSVLFDKLIPHSKNYVRINSYNRTDSSPPSKIITIDSRKEVTGPVIDFKVHKVMPTRIMVKWIKPIEIKGTLTGYKIILTMLISYYERPHVIYVNDSQATSAKFPVNMETKYNITICAITSAGEGEPFSIEIMTPPLIHLFDKPTFTVHKIPQENGFTDLKVIKDVEPEDILTNYFFVEYQMVGENTRNKTRFQKETNEIVISSLKNGHSYLVYVIAFSGSDFFYRK